MNDLQYILDVMSGADGGIKYVKLLTFVRECDERRDVNDIPLLDIVRKFANLTRVINDEDPQ